MYITAARGPVRSMPRHLGRHHHFAANVPHYAKEIASWISCCSIFFECTQENAGLKHAPAACAYWAPNTQIAVSMHQHEGSATFTLSARENW